MDNVTTLFKLLFTSRGTHDMWCVLAYSWETGFTSPVRGQGTARNLEKRWKMIEGTSIEGDISDWLAKMSKKKENEKCSKEKIN